DWVFGYVRARGEQRLAVLIARYPVHREAEPQWSAVARLPEGRWFDIIRGRSAVAGVPLREWLEPLPFAVLLTRWYGSLTWPSGGRSSLERARRKPRSAGSRRRPRRCRIGRRPASGPWCPGAVSTLRLHKCAEAQT